MENFVLLGKVGEGTYGTVYKAHRKATGELVAVKSSNIFLPQEGIPPTGLREISLLRMLSENENIVRLLGVEFNKSLELTPMPEKIKPKKQGNKNPSKREKPKPKNPKSAKPVLLLVFEYMSSDLKTLIEKYRNDKIKFPPLVIKKLMYQLLNGIAYCHSHGILHRDLKPHNLLVDESKVLLKIADFGLGRTFSVPMKVYTHEVVTLWYRAPELLLGCVQYSPAIDVWAIGCIFAELARTRPLFAAEGEVELIMGIFTILGTPNVEIWPGLAELQDWCNFPQLVPQNMKRVCLDLDEDGLDLLSKMLAYDPSKRISAKSAMNHRYFKDLDGVGHGHRPEK